MAKQMVSKNRRLKLGAIAIGLITAAFYACLFAGNFEMYNTYAYAVLGVYGFLVGGLTITDALHIKNGNKDKR